MEKYYCESCKYMTNKISNFKDHMKSKIHKTKSSIECDENTDYSNFKIIDTLCCICGDTYKKGNFVTKHVCDKNKIIEFALINKNEEIELLKKELKKRDEKIEEIYKKLDEKDQKKDDIITKAIDATISSNKVANTSMNMLRYARTYWNDVDPLEEINDKNICKVMNYKNPKNEENINETYVKTIIHKYNHGIFADFIGDMIIEYYKPTTLKKRNMMVTDVTRLCFIMMQKIEGKKTKKEWINDKSGERFIKLILDPMFVFVKKILNDYLDLNQKKDLTEYSLGLMAKCAELNRDIDVKKFTKSVLKYVGPHFHFDKLKSLDNDDDIDNSNNLSDEELTKKSKIVVNKKKAKN